MDYQPSEEQQAIVEAVERLLEQHAGPARAITLNKEGFYDTTLHLQLVEAGFSHIARDLANGEQLAGLEAALVVEAVARAASVVASSAQSLVAPALCADAMHGPIALCTREELQNNVPIRFAAHARTLLVLDGDSVAHVELEAGAFRPVRSSFGFPMGKRASADVLDKLSGAASRMSKGSADTMRNWWRLALAAEAVGTMDGALNHTVGYLKQRRQFGRAIGSFQAIQHRLANCAIDLEASRWLTREAAFHGAPAEASATAAAFALASADRIFTESHQMSGAIGFTKEFDLHVWSMRLPALRQELDGVGGARRDLVSARWGTSH